VAKAELHVNFDEFCIRSPPTSSTFEVHWAARAHQVKTYKDFVSVLRRASKCICRQRWPHGRFVRSQLSQDGKRVINDRMLWPGMAGPDMSPRSSKRFVSQHLEEMHHALPLRQQSQHIASSFSEESSSVDQLAAEKACAHQGKDDCVRCLGDR
jgi:hypothetical protein